jgi:hypothetical protein
MCRRSAGVIFLAIVLVDVYVAELVAEHLAHREHRLVSP